MIVTNAGDEEYEVEKILALHKLHNGQTRLHVKWTGYTKPTWEPLDNFRDITALELYETEYGPIDK